MFFTWVPGPQCDKQMPPIYVHIYIYRYIDIYIYTHREGLVPKTYLGNPGLGLGVVLTVWEVARSDLKFELRTWFVY